jgi:hypothetical protein
MTLDVLSGTIWGVPSGRILAQANRVYRLFHNDVT